LIGGTVLNFRRLFRQLVGARDQYARHGKAECLGGF